MSTGGAGLVSQSRNDHSEIKSGRTLKGGSNQCLVTGLRQYGDVSQQRHCCKGQSVLCAGGLVLLVFVITVTPCLYVPLSGGVKASVSKDEGLGASKPFLLAAGANSTLIWGGTICWLSPMSMEPPFC